MLRPWQSRTIPYGMDKRVFRPGDKLKARDALGLPRDAFIGVFVAQSGSRTNPYKDFDTVRKAVELLAPQNPPPDWLLVCIGGSKLPDEPRLRYAGYLSDPVQVAVYYQSADLLIHAAHADNYPLVVLEALTCGTPVVATDVGGIGEQIRHGETGFLVPEGDAEAMAQRVLQLMEQPNLLRTMGQAAAAQVRVAGSLAQHADAYLAWFEELLGRYPQEA
jgi:glycosyltransferase involved in cell wall biosynthesis